MQLNRPITQRRLARPNAGAAASGPKPGGPSFTTQAGGGNQFHPPSHPPRHHGDGIGYHVPGGVRPLGGGNGPSFAGAATAQAPNFGRVGAQQINPNAYAGNIPNLGTLSRAPVTPELVSTDLMDLDALEAGIINRADQQTARNRAMVLARSGGNLGGLGRLSYLAAEANPNEDLSRVRLSREQLRKNIESANADRTNQANQFNTGIEGEDFRINSGNRLAEAGLDQTNQGRAAGIAQGNQSANLSAAQANARLREAEWGARFQQDRASRGDFESDRGFDESQRRYDLDRQDRLDAQDDLRRRLRRPSRGGGRRLRRPSANPPSPSAAGGYRTQGGGGGLARGGGGGLARRGGGGGLRRAGMVPNGALGAAMMDPESLANMAAGMTPEEKWKLEAAIAEHGQKNMRTGMSSSLAGAPSKKRLTQILNAPDQRTRDAIAREMRDAERYKHRPEGSAGINMGIHSGPLGTSYMAMQKQRGKPLSAREAQVAAELGIPETLSDHEVRLAIQNRTVYAGGKGLPVNVWEEKAKGSAARGPRGGEGEGGVGHGGRFAPGLNERNAADAEMVEYQGRIMPREVARRTKEGDDYSAWLEIQRQLAEQAQGDGVTVGVGEPGSQYAGPDVGGANSRRRGLRRGGGMLA